MTGGNTTGKYRTGQHSLKIENLWKPSQLRGKPGTPLKQGREGLESEEKEEFEAVPPQGNTGDSLPLSAGGKQKW